MIPGNHENFSGRFKQALCTISFSYLDLHIIPQWYYSTVWLYNHNIACYIYMLYSNS